MLKSKTEIKAEMKSLLRQIEYITIGSPKYNELSSQIVKLSESL